MLLLTLTYSNRLVFVFDSKDLFFATYCRFPSLLRGSCSLRVAVDGEIVEPFEDYGLCSRSTDFNEL